MTQFAPDSATSHRHHSLEDWLSRVIVGVGLEPEEGTARTYTGASTLRYGYRPESAGGQSHVNPAPMAAPSPNPVAAPAPATATAAAPVAFSGSGAGPDGILSRPFQGAWFFVPPPAMERSPIRGRRALPEHRQSPSASEYRERVRHGRVGGASGGDDRCEPGRQPPALRDLDVASVSLRPGEHPIGTLMLANSRDRSPSAPRSLSGRIESAPSIRNTRRHARRTPAL